MGEFVEGIRLIKVREIVDLIDKVQLQAKEYGKVQ